MLLRAIWTDVEWSIPDFVSVSTASRSSLTRLSLAAESTEKSAEELIAEARAAAAQAKAQLAALQESPAGTVGPAATSVLTETAEEESPESSYWLSYESAADALLDNPDLQDLMSSLISLRKLPGGDMAVSAAMIRLCQVLEEPKSNVNWDQLVGDAKAWEIAGVSAEEVKQQLQGASILLGAFVLPTESMPPYGDMVEITSRTGLIIEGKWWDKPVRLQLERSQDGEKLWGIFSSYVVKEGPAGLLGKRVTGSAGGLLAQSEYHELRAGDQLFLEEPARAALYDLAAYDRLPDKSRNLNSLIDRAEAEGGEDDGAIEIGYVDPKIKELVADRRVREAARFVERLNNLPSQRQKGEERLKRFSSNPVVQQLLAQLQADPEAAEVLKQMEPFAGRIYDAVRAKRLLKDGSRSTEDDDSSVTTMEIDFTFFQLFGVLIVIAVLAYAAANVAKSALTTASSEELPLYSLKAD